MSRPRRPAPLVAAALVAALASPSAHAWRGVQSRPSGALRSRAAVRAADTMVTTPETSTAAPTPPPSRDIVSGVSADPSKVAAAFKPGLAERETFTLDPSVDAWAAWDAKWAAPPAASPSASVPGSNALLEELVPAILEDVRADPVRAGPYYGYHLGRSLFFLGAWAGVYLSSLRPATGSEGGGGAAFLLQSSVITPQSGSTTLQGIPRLFAEALSAFHDDLACITAGEYPLPFDMTELRHRQYDPLATVRELGRFLPEALATLRRRQREEPEPVWLGRGEARAEGALYPEYYDTFHFQSDGWLSSDSSRTYEFSTETLFLGRQDAMQRLTLRPLCRFAEERAAAEPGRALDYLEIACGTGRFLTFTLDALGERVRSATALDLSPFYLERARENVEYARALRAERGQAAHAPVRFIQANAELVPLPDQSMDAITSVYLFHELPTSAVRAVAREVGRLLRPGGLFVLTDSQQLGDRPDADGRIGNFARMNEPFYLDFLATDFAAIFREEAGLEPEWKGLRSATKCLSFRKPRAAVSGSGLTSGPGSPLSLMEHQ